MKSKVSANPRLTIESKEMPPFASLRAFEAVFRLGGIRKAAAALSLNHAVVSRHIRFLEDWVGAPILTRSGNRLCLTEVGEHYHARISASLMDLVHATRECRGQLDATHIRLWCLPGLCMQWLPNQLIDFQRKHPGYLVDLKPSEVAANLMVHEADADIRYFMDNAHTGLAKGLKAFELVRPTIMAVATPELAGKLKLNKRGSRKKLDASLIHIANHDQWRIWLKLNNLNTPDELPGLLCHHPHLAIAAAKLGRGIALASRFLVQDDLAAGRLVEVRIGEAKRVALGTYVLVAREDKWSGPALRSMRQFLRDRATELEGTNVDKVYWND